MSTVTAMYHSGRNPLKRISRHSESVIIPKGLRVRRLHKAFLRYHDPNNWPLLREALRRMGRAELIGSSRLQLVPSYQPPATAAHAKVAAAKPTATRPAQPMRTQHTGLPRVPTRLPARKPRRDRH